MSDSLLTGLALARPSSWEPLTLRTESDWWARVVAGGAVGVQVRGEQLDATDGRLRWRQLTADDEPRAVLLAEHGDRVRVALLADDAPGWPSLREIGSKLDDEDAAAATAAVALAQWHHRHRHCPRCGAQTEVIEAGWVRRCPRDGSTHFPRTDPAVIVLVRDAEDRALLGRRAIWPEGWFSTLAGFVEAGESAEHAVVREIAEEAGVVVDGTALKYRGSQPWPFPASLMLGYHAWTRPDSPTARADGEEIVEVRWFHREEMAALAETGAVKIPPSVSIARHLIEDWYGAPLPGEWSR